MEIASRRREQEVWQACDDLWALYGTVGSITGEAIRERLVELGKSRGSPNEIYKYRKSWTLSRGVGQEMPAHNSIESDPITRAVRLVHEKIHSETQEEIEKLKLQFNEELLAKDELIHQGKKDILALMNEFSVLQHNYAQLVQNNKELAEQHAVEIELRKALEKDMSLIKFQHAEALRSHEHIMAELYKNQSYTCEHIKSAFSQAEQSLRTTIAELEKEKKQLGQEYSEQLNMIRIEKYNKDLQIKELESSNTKLNESFLLCKQKISDYEFKLKTVLDDSLRWHNETEIIRSKIELVNTELAINNKQCEKLKRENIKRDVIIARLRALLAHGGNYEPSRERSIARGTSFARSKFTEAKLSDSSKR